MSWECLEKERSYCSLPVAMGWDVMRLLGREKEWVVSLTICWSCGEMAWQMKKTSLTSFSHAMRSNMTAWQKIMIMSLTFCWSWDIRLLCGQKGCSYLLPVGHDMVCDANCLVGQVHYHSLPVGHIIRCDETAYQKARVLSPTSCWA